MAANDARRTQWWVIAMGVLAVLLIAAVLHLALDRSRRPSIVPEDALVKLRISELVREEAARAEKLELDGQHLEAARARVHYAAAVRLLFPEQRDTAEMAEYFALVALRRAGKDQPYREFLRSLYPEWESRDEDLPGHRTTGGQAEAP